MKDSKEKSIGSDDLFGVIKGFLDRCVDTGKCVYRKRVNNSSKYVNYKVNESIGYFLIFGGHRGCSNILKIWKNNQKAKELKIYNFD